MKYFNEEFTIEQIDWEKVMTLKTDMWECCLGLPITFFYFKKDDKEGYLELNRENPNDVYVLATGFIPEVFKAETGAETGGE